MALGNPIEAFIQATQGKNKNQQQMYQDIAGMGQGLGEGLGAIGEAVKAHKQKQLIAQLVQAMQGQGQPMSQIQGPQGYMPPNQTPSPTSIPMTPVGKAPPGVQDNTGQINSLMMQLSPEKGMEAQFDRMNPYKQALTNQANAEAEAKRRPPIPKVPLEYVDTGRTTKDGKAIYLNKATGEELVGGTAGTPKPAMGSAMAGERARQFGINDLPSNQGQNTAGGAAYQVKIGARQGKALISKPGSPQRTGAARADLVRAITRVAPTDEGLRNVNFSDNVAQRWAQLKQQLTVDPSAVDNPKIRKEMYDIFDDMEKSSEPFIVNQLDELQDQGYNITPATRRRQLGLNFPEVKFIQSLESLPKLGGETPQIGGMLNGKKIIKVEPL